MVSPRVHGGFLQGDAQSLIIRLKGQARSVKILLGSRGAACIEISRRV